MNAIESVEFMKRGGIVKHLQDPPSKCHHRMFRNDIILKLEQCSSCAANIKQRYTIQKWIDIANNEGEFVSYEH